MNMDVVSSVNSPQEVKGKNEVKMIDNDIANDIDNDIANEIDNEDLGKDAFFELLITQLRHQDPLDPMDDRDFLAQMAQFSSLEQMQNMNESMTALTQMRNIDQGANLIGKMVESVEYDENGEKSVDVSGVVEKIVLEGEESFAVLDNGLSVGLDEITAIYQE